MPRRRKTVAVDPAKSKTPDCKRASENVANSNSDEVLLYESALHSSSVYDGGDPGPAGFNWKELEP